MKRAVVVGSGGQDGSLLFDRLERDGCAVVGIERGKTRARGVRERAPVDILDRDQVRALVSSFRPDEVYYLAAHHGSSEDGAAEEDLELLEASHEVHVVGLLHFLEALRSHRPTASLLYAASSRIFGDPGSETQDEDTPLAPRCVYGITKAYGTSCCRLYRRVHSLRASVGILYNHESPGRRAGFVSRKIVDGAVDIRLGRRTHLAVADLGARVDWGYAPDFVEAMIRIAAMEEPGDFVVATGVARSVLEFVEVAFGLAGLDWRKHVVEDPSLVARPSPTLAGNARKLRSITGWAPSVSFEEMVGILYRAACSRGAMGK